MSSSVTLFLLTVFWFLGLTDGAGPGIVPELELWWKVEAGRSAAGLGRLAASDCFLVNILALVKGCERLSNHVIILIRSGKLIHGGIPMNMGQ